MLRLLVAFLLLALGASAVLAKPRSAEPERSDSAAGENLYLNGVLASGEPLVGTRANAVPSRGEVVACGNCHRRSGLGSQEGRTQIPPITGRFLFESHDTARERAGEGDPLPYIPGERLDRTPYTEATFERVLRDGVDSQGRTLSYLMPRFALGAQDLSTLITHLRALDRRRIPGVSAAELHFATILTPDADPVKRGAVLQVLEQFVKDRNVAPRAPGGVTMATSGNTAYARSMFKVSRRWVLHVWQLTGSADSWGVQLERKMSEEPVFAVISGVGGANWDPVAQFCERRAVPCLFPNVDAPPADADSQFHSLYFSRGVLLEASLIAAQMNDKRVRLVYREGDAGAAGARALATALKPKGVSSAIRVIGAHAPAQAVVSAVRDLAPDEALMLWLRPVDLKALEGLPAPPGSVYLSGVMGGLDGAPLPRSWREHALMTYPADLPAARRVRVDYALGWFRIRQIPVVAEQAQADTYLACGLLSETLKHMVDAFIPDYLIERLEDTLDHRVITGYYPRLTLGPHQRFASKGGYLTRFEGATRGGVMAATEWLTP
jgi:hypothetical protein